MFRIFTNHLESLDLYTTGAPLDMVELSWFDVF